MYCCICYSPGIRLIFNVLCPRSFFVHGPQHSKEFEARFVVVFKEEFEGCHRRTTKKGYNKLTTSVKFSHFTINGTLTHTSWDISYYTCYQPRLVSWESIGDTNNFETKSFVSIVSKGSLRMTKRVLAVEVLLMEPKRSELIFLGRNGNGPERSEL